MIPGSLRSQSTGSRPAATSASVNTRNVTGPYANSANGIINADKGYKTGETPTSGGGGGGSGLPANPCGG